MQQNPIQFRSLRIRNWRQFERVGLEFHSNLTVITGANGAGKTTILNILSRHFGWNLQLASTPRKMRKGLIEYFSDSDQNSENSEVFTSKKNQTPVGEIRYTNNSANGVITVPTNVSQQYNINIENQAKTEGIYISSHRPVYFYQQVQSIPAKLDAKEQLLKKYANELRQRYNHNAKNSSASFRIKEAIISLATFGYGNEAVSRNDDAVAMFEGFERVLRIMLPEALGFQRIAIHMPEIVFETKTGSFSFDSVSGGIASIIDVTWQIFLASMAYDKFIVVMDEPENHLHPKLQRTLLPNLVNSFPNVQFIVATHNPFMVTSVPDANVYALSYNDRNRVESEPLDLLHRSGTANEILREVLGLESTMPVWAEKRLQEVVASYANKNLTGDSIQALKSELQELGLYDFFPKAIDQIMQDREA